MSKIFYIICPTCKGGSRYLISEMQEARKRGYFICKRCSDKILTNQDFDHGEKKAE